jgi:sulfur-oxidizing protein SoxY
MPSDMVAHHDTKRATRRGFLVGAAQLAGGVGLLSIFPCSESRALPDMLQAAIKKVVGDAPLRKGRVTLGLPPMVENGNAVSVEVSVESPMTASDHVKAIHVFNEKNPQPYVLNVRLGPHAGKARVSTRIRLATTQQVIAIAEMSDGSFWSDAVDTFVALAACQEDPG